MTSTTRQGVGPEDSLGDSDASDRQDREAGTVLVGPDSDQTPVLSVVMPTLNEEEGIAECIDRVTTAVRELGVPTEVVVSDSSTDRTPETERENGVIVSEPAVGVADATVRGGTRTDCDGESGEGVLTGYSAPGGRVIDDEDVLVQKTPSSGYAWGAASTACRGSHVF